ncbi:MAG: HD domain-containing protein [Candidatus Moranbacteria bacterium]|nr:HD domain-containing protein [Candidatus Moranbacteria bacterium]
MSDMETVPFEFLALVGKLKTTFRYEELLAGRRESVADHSYRLSLMVSLYGNLLETDEKRHRALRMAVVHDIAEAVTGDIDYVRVASGEITREEKKSLEADALDRIGSALSEGHRDAILSLNREYDEGTTDVARFVKALDKLETLLQLVELGYRAYDRPELIANYADAAVERFPSLRPALADIKKRLREEFLKGDIEWKPSYDMPAS